MKTHYGKAANGYIWLACGAQGVNKGRGSNLNSVIGAKHFAHLMATEPEQCCAHCVNEIKKRLPNTVANAAKDPVAYAKKHNLY